MTAFAAATSVLFADANLAEDGTYVAVGGGGATAVRIVVRRADPSVALFESGAHAPGWLLTIPTATIATKPAAGATITTTARTYTVHDVREDASQLVWELDCY